MGIPLNIDWQQILLHFFNFVLLAGGLYLLLYKPVKNFMNSREQYYKDQEAESKRLVEQSEQLKKEYSDRIKNAENEIIELKKIAAKETKESTEKQLQEAKEEAKQIIKHSKDLAKIERDRIVKEAHEQVTKLALQATKKLIEDNQADAVRQFVSSSTKDEK